MRELLGIYRTDIIPEKEMKLKSYRKQWEYGYNNKYDVVIISKDGTLGSIYEIEGIKIGLPRIPNKLKVINNKAKKENQKWKRTPLPIGLREENQEEHEDYILEEYRRRKEGVFINIGGETEYFPGCYYFFLQWFSIGRIYPHFRYTQRDLMIFWEACFADPRCYGILYVKNRRLGWSTLKQSETNNRGTNFREGLIGIISKTGKDAKSFFRKTVSGFRKLPFFFKPQTDGTTNPKTELSFIKPAKRITHKTKADYQDGEEALNTYIMWYNTDLNSMDGEKIAPIMVIDEPGKFPKNVPFSEYWDVVKECLLEGEELVGKAMVGSTINPPDKGGDEFKIVWNQSDIDQRDGNNETVSGLYRIFIKADYNIRGYFDEFGFPIVEDPETPMLNNEGKLKKIGSKTYLDNKEESFKNDPEKLAARKRKYPRTIIDAFRSANDTCSFNAQKLYEQMDYIEQEMPQSMIQIGDLRWEGGVQDSTVKFVPNSLGNFRFTWQPPKEIRNKYSLTPYGKTPGNKHLGALGVDPYNRTKTSDGRGSLGSIHGLTKDSYQGIPSNHFFLEYIARPQKVELFYEDVIKAMVYTGMPAAIEQSNDEFLKILKTRGYRPFVLTRPGVHFKDLTPTEREIGGFPPQGNKIGNAQFYAVESYIDDHVGIARVKEYRKLNDIGKMYFIRTLMQWLSVDPENRTKFDAYISSSLAIIANQRRLVVNPTKLKKVFINPLTKYNNTGAVSKKAVSKISA